MIRVFLTCLGWLNGRAFPVGITSYFLLPLPPINVITRQVFQVILDRATLYYLGKLILKMKNYLSHNYI